VLNRGLSQATFAAALRDAARPPPSGLAAAARGASLVDRFAVYRANHAVSLREALAEQFPVCRRLVGGEFFDAVAAAYVGTEPPREASLHGYGATFGAFVRGFPPCASVDYLGDVADLEFAWRAAWGAADAPVLRTADLAGLPPQRLIDTPLSLHPAVGRLRSPHPVASIWLAHQGDDPVRPPESWAPEAVLVCRPDADVTVAVLDHATAALLDALAGGRPLADAAAAAGPGIDCGPLFLTLVGHGAFLPLPLSRTEPSR
jgi:hypothetical protein